MADRYHIQERDWGKRPLFAKRHRGNGRRWLLVMVLITAVFLLLNQAPLTNLLTSLS